MKDEKDTEKTRVQGLGLHQRGQGRLDNGKKHDMQGRGQERCSYE